MELIVSVARTAVPVLLAIAAGYFCQKKQIVKKEAIEEIKSLVMNIMLPSMVFVIFLSAEYNAQVLISIGVMYAFAILGLILAIAIRKLLKIRRKFFPCAVITYEGLLGYAFYTLLFGEEHLSRYAVFDLAQGLFVFTIFMTTVNKWQGTVGEGPKAVVKSMLKTPTLMANIAGLVLGATGVGAMILNNPIGSVITESLDYVGGPTVVLMLVIVGYGLKFSKPLMKEAAVTALFRYLISAILCVSILGLFSLLMEIDYFMFWAIVLEFSLPPAYCITVLVRDERETNYIDSALSLCTLVSIILFIFISIFIK